MKTKLFILIFIILSFRIFASNSLEVTYKTDNIRINYFLGYQEEIFLPDISENEKFKNIEKNFYDFIYFTDALIEISNRIDANIYFYSEHDLSELTIGEKNIYLSRKGDFLKYKLLKRIILLQRIIQIWISLYHLYVKN